MTREEQIETMRTEAHRLLDVWATCEALYYATTKPESDTAMHESLAAQYAASAIITARALAMSNRHRCVLTTLRDAIDRETNESSRRHMTEVLKKLAAEDVPSVSI